MDVRLISLALFAFFVCVVCRQEPAGVSVRHPVILIPGDGASQMEIKLNKTTSKYWYCRKHTSNYKPAWLSILNLMPLKINCLVENLRLWYNSDTHKTHNTPGVSIKVPAFGNTSAVEFLDRHKQVPYFYEIVQNLVSIGYSRGLSVRGAPYDFRKAPNELADYYVQLKDLVEDTYTKNNNTKVVVISHSMGGPVFLYFLNKQSQSWKDKFIQSFVSLAGVWGGSAKSIKLVLSGFDLNFLLINRKIIRKVQRSLPSTAFLLPSDQFWNSSEILVSTPDKNYTVINYKELFQDLHFIDGYSMRKDTENLVRDLVPPEVPVHCIHGSNVPTPETYVFKRRDFPDKDPSSLNGDGDGSVNMRSLLGCTRWIGQQMYTVIHKVYKGSKSSHIPMLFNTDVINYILDVVTGDKSFS